MVPESVYGVAIAAIAAVVLGVVWMLRTRISSGKIEVSAKTRALKGQFEALPSAESRERSKQEPPSSCHASVNVADNIMIGGNIVRVFRGNVSIIRNRLLGRQRLDVGKSPPRKPGSTR